MAIVFGPKIPQIMVEAGLSDNYFISGNSMLRALQPLIQPNVINLTTNTPPGSPSNGDTYVVGSAPTGAWTGEANAIAYWSTDDPAFPSGAWEFYTPLAGWVVGNQADVSVYVFSGSAWARVSGITLQTNGTANSNQGLLNIASGAGISVTNVSGTTTITNTASSTDVIVTEWDAITSSSSFSLDVGATGGEWGATQVLPASRNIQTLTSATGGHGLQEGKYNAGTEVDGTIPISLLSYLEFQIAFASDDTARHWVGMANFNAVLSSSGSMSFDTFVGESASNAYDFVGFRFSPHVPDTFWQAYVGGSSLGSATITSTGVAPTFNSVPHLFKITSTGGNFLFYIDGTLVATIAIPALYLTTFGSGTYETHNGCFLTTLEADTNIGGSPSQDWYITYTRYGLLV